MVSGALRRHKSKSPMCVDRVKRNEPFPTRLSDPKIKDKKVWTDSEPIPKDIPTHLRFDNDVCCAPKRNDAKIRSHFGCLPGVSNLENDYISRFETTYIVTTDCLDTSAGPGPAG